MNFKDFIVESSKEGKNVHLEHIEDEVINRGVPGARDAINFLRSLRDMLAGNADSKVNVTTKWDGAPAVFAGVNPENGKFFVATKGIFNVDAKLNYTDEDIDRNHPGEGLNKKLKTALTYLPKLGIDGILQGDMMFGEDDLGEAEKEIDGQMYLTFKPNTIVYAVPVESKLAKSMKAAKMGIVFHTSYTGKTIASLKASFNIDINNLKKTKDVWFRDAYFIDASGTVTFTKEETKQITSILSQAGTVFSRINSLSMNRIAASDIIQTQIKTFNNTKVRSGQKITNPVSHAVELTKWVEDKLNKEILSAKKKDTKEKRMAEKNELVRFYRGNNSDLVAIFTLQNLLVDAKNMIIKKLQQIKQVTNTFVQTDDGYKITNPEGFVAVDKLKGNAVKLVDRLEFSHLNFTAQKNWSK
jgi:hypothetical protein